MYPFQPSLPFYLFPPSTARFVTLLRFSSTSCNIASPRSRGRLDGLSDGPRAELRPALLSFLAFRSAPWLSREIPWSFSRKWELNDGEIGNRRFSRPIRRGTVKGMELKIWGEFEEKKWLMERVICRKFRIEFKRNESWVDLINSTFLKISLRCYVRIRHGVIKCESTLIPRWIVYDCTKDVDASLLRHPWWGTQEPRITHGSPRLFWSTVRPPRPPPSTVSPRRNFSPCQLALSCKINLPKFSFVYEKGS